jgi:hypothetical protein
MGSQIGISQLTQRLQISALSMDLNGGDWRSFKDYPHFEMTFGRKLK